MYTKAETEGLLACFPANSAGARHFWTAALNLENSAITDLATAALSGENNEVDGAQVINFFSGDVLLLSVPLEPNGVYVHLTRMFSAAYTQGFTDGKAQGVAAGIKLVAQKESDRRKPGKRDITDKCVRLFKLARDGKTDTVSIDEAYHLVADSTEWIRKNPDVRTVKEKIGRHFYQISKPYVYRRTKYTPNYASSFYDDVLPEIAEICGLTVYEVKEAMARLCTGEKKTAGRGRNRKK